MWYINKAKQKVWNASKNLIDKRTPIQKLLDTISDCKQQILPTNKLSQLASQTYQVQAFDQIVTIIFEKLKKFNYDLDESQKSLNILVATHYIIKHGATGFVDQFRKYLGMFEKYQKLQSKEVYEDRIMQGRLQDNLDKIKSRAHHIHELLSNKEKLLKEKQLSMLVKQKLKLYQKNKLSQLKNQHYSNSALRQKNKQTKAQGGQQAADSKSDQKLQQKVKKLGNRAQQLLKHPEQMSVKLQGILQTYLWKYVDRLDDTIETASQKVMQQIDKYVLGQEAVHVPFQMEDDQEDQMEGNGKEKAKGKGKSDSGKKLNKNKLQQEQIQDDDQLMKKLQQQVKDVKITGEKQVNLLDFEQVDTNTKKQQVKKQVISQDLI